VTDREVVTLTGDRGCESPAEGINHWWVSALGLAWLLEGRLHESHGVVGEERVLLVLGHGVITCSEEVLRDLAITEGLLVSSGRRIALDADGAMHWLGSALGGIHVGHLLLDELLLLRVVLVLLSAADTVVHESLDCLLALRSLGLELVKGVVENLSVVREEFSKLLEVKFDHGVLVEQLSNDVEDIRKNGREHCFVDTCDLQHGGEVGLQQRLEEDVRSLALELCHLRFVGKLEVAEEVLTETDVENPNVVFDLLVSNCTKLGHINCPSCFGLGETPLDEGVPDQVIGGLTDDASNRVGIASEVPFNSLIAEAFNIIVAVATVLLHFHCLNKNKSSD